MEDLPREDLFGFRRGRGNRGAIWMMRIISKRWDVDKDLCYCFTD